MQPLTGLATSVVKVRRSESSTQLKVHSSPSGESGESGEWESLESGRGVIKSGTSIQLRLGQS